MADIIDISKRRKAESWAARMLTVDRGFVTLHAERTFLMTPEHAEALAQELRLAARKAREDKGAT